MLIGVLFLLSCEPDCSTYSLASYTKDVSAARCHYAFECDTGFLPEIYASEEECKVGTEDKLALGIGECRGNGYTDFISCRAWDEVEMYQNTCEGLRYYSTESLFQNEDGEECRDSPVP